MGLENSLTQAGKSDAAAAAAAQQSGENGSSLVPWVGGALGQIKSNEGKTGDQTVRHGGTGTGDGIAGGIAGGAADLGAKLGDAVTRHNIPSIKDRIEAQGELSKDIERLVPPAEREAVRDLATALTSGDKDDFAKALTKIGAGDLKDVINDLDKVLRSNGSDTRVGVTEDGNVLLSEMGQSTALSFNPESGNVTSKPVETLKDGTVIVKPGEVLHSDQERSFSSMSRDIVDSANHPHHHGFDPGIVKPFPVSPGRPRVELPKDIEFTPL